MPPDVLLEVGKRIRKERNWRQIDLSQQAGIHEVHVSDLERGAREVGLRHLAALAKAFELTLSEFLMDIKNDRCIAIRSWSMVGRMGSDQSWCPTAQIGILNSRPSSFAHDWIPAQQLPILSASTICGRGLVG